MNLKGSKTGNLSLVHERVKNILKILHTRNGLNSKGYYQQSVFKVFKLKVLIMQLNGVRQCYIIIYYSVGGFTNTDAFMCS